ncbi:MAG: hypothetical protein AAGA68_26830 [Pseudomonadota bacterium]
MIGTTHAWDLTFTGLGGLKRDFLFFDQLALVTPTSTMARWRGLYGKRRHREWADELEYLLSTGEVIGSDHYLEIRRSASAPPNEAVDEYIRLVRRNQEIFDELDKLMHQAREDGAQPPDLDRVQRLSNLNRSLQVRSCAQQFCIEGREAVCIDGLPDPMGLQSTVLTSGDMLRLAIDNVPLVSDTTPWQDLFELKSDADLVARARKLRLWAREIAASGYDAAYAKEHLDDLLNDYERYLALHKAKYTRGIISAFLAGSAELIESIGGLKLGKIVQCVLSARGQKTDLLISELEAPGREVSMISRLRDELEQGSVRQ